MSTRENGPLSVFTSSRPIKERQALLVAKSAKTGVANHDIVNRPDKALEYVTLEWR